MKFNEYKENYPIFAVIERDGIEVKEAKVTAVSQPYFPNVSQITAASLSQNKVVDITIAMGDSSKIYTFPEGSSIASTSDNIVFTDRDGVIRELNALKAQSEDALRKVEQHKKRVEDCKALLAEFDPVAKKDAAFDARVSQLESSIKGINSSIDDLKSLIISKLNS